MTSETPRRHRYHFRRTMRIRQRREFERIFADGARTSDHLMTLWARANDLPYPRLGLIVGRRQGNAVRRNQLKRLLREGFRLSRHELPAGLDFLCAPRPGAGLTVTEAQRSLATLSRRLARRLAKQAGAFDRGSKHGD